MHTNVRPNHKPKRNRTTQHLAIAAGGAAGLAGLVAFVLLAGGGSHGQAAYTCGSDRTIISDLSSANRSDAAVEVATEVIAAHTIAAKICGEALTVVGVAAGTQVLVSPADPIGELRGPNSRARARDVEGLDSAVTESIAAALDGVYSAYPDVAVTSIPALYQAAADHSAAGSRVVILTTGVNDESDVTLNRPLEPGEGARLADTMTWPTLAPETTIVVIGIAQMDEGLPAPGAMWPGEVKAFNDTACAATGATCATYQVVEPIEALV